MTPPCPLDDSPAQHPLRRQHKLWLRTGRWIAAVLLFAFSIFCVVLPGIPGPPFLLLGLFLIAPDYPPARRLAAKIMRKLPKRLRQLIPKRFRQLPPRARKPHAHSCPQRYQEPW
jgi:hypothetical protein